MPRLAVALFGAALLAACSTDDVQYDDITRPAKRTQAEIDFAKQTLNDLQDISIKKNREYCGYIGLSPEGGFYASKPTRGRKGSCRPKAGHDDDGLLASYHTHGGFSDDFNSETPSLDDVIAGMEESLDGYIATPGGRLWFTDAETGTSTQLCGAGCLTADAEFDPGLDPDIQRAYTLEALEALED